jgi:DNA-binding response OmpR family regulator
MTNVQSKNVIYSWTKRHVSELIFSIGCYLRDSFSGRDTMEYIGGLNLGSRVLVIDDDPDIAKLLTAILKPLGFVVFTACDGMEGLKNAYELHPDLVILDVMMPGMDGWEVCTRLRELSDVPILMLTARSAEADMLRGFVLGVDDYMKKPFSKAELEARVRALLRRQKHHNGGPDVSRYADTVLNIDLETRSVELHGETLDLSVTEYDLLSCLVRNMGRTVTHRQLLREVWGCEHEKLSTTLTLYVHHLRKKLKDGRHNHEYLHTQWGVGYCFVPVKEF